MAKRLLLVPEDTYKGLISSASVQKNAEPFTKPSHDLVEKGSLDIAQAETQKHLHRRKKLRKNIIRRRKQRTPGEQNKLKGANLSARKVLYDQALRRYLRLREEAKNRPIKVELTPKGSKVLIKRGPMLGRSPSIHSATLDDEGNVSDGFISNGFNENRDDNSLISSHGDPIKEYFETPKFTPGGRHFTIANRLEQSNRRKEMAIKALKNFIMVNKDRFPITDDGLYIKPNLESDRIIKNSDLEASIERILDPSVENAPSPPGTTVLRKFLLFSPYGGVLSRRSRNFTSRISPVDFNLDYTTPSTSHIGKGVKNNSHLKTFRPSIWNVKSY